MTLMLQACSFTGSPAQTRLVSARLPTLTRTPLPTLTPTFAAPLAGITEINAPNPIPVEAQPAHLPALLPTPLPLAAGPTEPVLEEVAQPALAPLSNEAVPVVEAAEVTPVAEVTTVDSPVSPAAPVVAPSSPLPAETSTPLPTPTETPLPTDTAIPTATATETPLPTDTPTPTLTPTPQVWAFSGVRTYPNPYDDGLLMYGNLINNTSTSQQLKSIFGTFYDTQNQVIAGPDSGDSYWPGYTISPGGSMPFELTVESVGEVANFDLSVDAEPSDETPRQDFEFLDIEEQREEDSYCVAGEVRNSGDDLEEYLVIALILYDSQENVISFSYYEELGPDWIEDDDTLEFELCSDLLDQAVAHHSLQAWGR